MSDIDVINTTLAAMTDENVANIPKPEVTSNAKSLTPQIVQDLIGKFRNPQGKGLVQIAQETPFLGTYYTATLSQVKLVYAAWLARLQQIAEEEE